ncbi:hypothetical protein RJ55_00528 [Drechmeria coniospora]|nr:hypothetical protein RJ55_00528 [Drechmeria coniospora]
MAERLSRSQALDDLIMGTNSSSIVSKRSVERLYYPTERHFFRYFVKKFQRRAPLINRGYWLRLKAIDVIVGQFFARPSAKKKVVINLGCGSDVLPWQSHDRHDLASKNALFIDVDYPSLMLRKRAIVLETPQLVELLGADFSVSESDDDLVLLKSPQYCQIGCDLRQLDKLRTTLETVLRLSDCEVLFVAEVSVTYMDTHSADALIHWASSIGTPEFCLLEQILPHGPDHPFAQTMLKHFDKLKTPPRSVFQYPTLASQQARFQKLGWAHVSIWDLWEAWSNEYFVSSTERVALDHVEAFDEWEEFVLFARHYFVLHASTSRLTGEQAVEQVSTMPSNRDCRAEVNIVCHHDGTNKRRFGEAMTISDAMGRQFALHMMGSDAKGRSDTVDIFSLGPSVEPPRLPLKGPLPRMCHTVTDLGDFGLLLVGGRASPTSVFSDCWIFSKGVDCRWQPTWKLPTSLFRHSTIRLKGTSLALVMGGKSDGAKVSEDFYLFHPTQGWRKCQVRGSTPRPTFGAVVCGTSGPSSGRGIFHGILAGGMGQDGCIVTDEHVWCLDINGAEPLITFDVVAPEKRFGRCLSLFGAQCVDLDSCTLVCGGIGHDASFQGRELLAVNIDHGNESCTVLQLRPRDGAVRMPFMIGSSALPNGKNGLLVFGGGATCFSMGTFWETGVFSIALSNLPWNDGKQSPLTVSLDTAPRYVESRKVVGITNYADGEAKTTARKVVPEKIPRVKLSQGMEFGEIIGCGKPVILEGLDLGHGGEGWTPELLVKCVGEQTEVVIHECHRDTDRMDFNTKNFRYVTAAFGTVMAKIQAGDRVYLRSLSREQPSEQAANIECDFPGLAAKFRLPAELEDHVSKNVFSSVLRVSGRVNMWLHYDVMANIYTQLVGSKRMILFPPSDVTRLSFLPGASSSSADVFSMLETTSLTGTRPHEALLQEGDVLFLPALWLHTAMPMSDLNVAVNVFFRDLDSGYATGRDVYGNRDLAAYEKGRQDAGRIARSFQPLPLETRRFYLARIADELQQAAEGL